MRQKISLFLLAMILPVLVFNVMALEGRELYHPDMSRFKDPMVAIAGSPLQQKIQEVYFKTTDGVRLNGWYVPAKPGRPTVVFAHGNGGNMGNHWDVAQAFTAQGYGFLGFDYRGFGKSEGSPNEQGLYRDMEAASRFLAFKSIPFQQQIALGESLGSGVVVDVATRIPYRAVVLYAAYTSTPDVAVHLQEQNRLGWLRILPVKQIMRQRFDSLAKIERIHCPLVIMHGTRDRMMPLWMPRALYAKAMVSRKRLILIPDASHDSVFTEGQRQLFSALAAFT